MFMMFELVGMSMTPETIKPDFGIHPITCLENIVFETSKSEQKRKCWKRRLPKNP